MRRRVLILEPAGNLWGSEQVLLDLLDAIPTFTWEVAVCCPPATPIIEPVQQRGVRVFPTFVSNLHQQGRPARARALFGVLSAAVRYRPHLLYVNQAGATRIALAVARLLRIPVVTHVRLAEDVRYIAQLDAPATALPRVICISEFIRKLFRAEPKVSATQLRTLYDAYRRRPDSMGEPSPCGSGRVPVFSCVGRLAQTKGQDVLLYALRTLNDEGVMACARFVGAAGPNDSFAHALQTLAAELNIEDQAEWVGQTRNVFPLMQQCVAQICPSRVEPLGRVIFDAWHVGLVPIAWEGSGGPAEVIRKCGGGILYAEQTGESLAAAMREVLCMSPAQRLVLVQRGQEWLATNCAPDRYVGTMLRWWDEAIQTRL